MNGERYLSLVVALACIGAVGMTATTFESTLETEPDHVIDFEYEHLPIGKDDVKDAKREAYMNRKGGQSNSAGGGGGSSSGAGAVELPPTCSSGPIVGVLSSLVPSVGPCMSVFYLLGAVIPLFLLLLLLGLFYRYRYRLIAPGFAVGSWLRDRGLPLGGTGTSTWPTEAPANDVQHAWLTMVQRANLDRPWSRTPAECARAAVDAGLNSEAVDTITGLFEEVRYGDAPLTAERRRRAREWRQRLEEPGG